MLWKAHNGATFIEIIREHISVEEHTMEQRYSLHISFHFQY